MVFGHSTCSARKGILSLVIRCAAPYNPSVGEYAKIPKSKETGISYMISQKFVLFCGLLGSVGALQATTVYLGSITGDPTINYNGTNYAVSPYTGTLGSSTTNPQTNNPSVELFCDDFADHSTVNTSWSVNETLVSATGTGTADDRFSTTSGAPNSNNPTYNNATNYPTATTLYEQMAWLFTQMSDTGISQGDRDDIQEAVWEMTGTSGSTPTATQSGATKSAAQWISLAQTYYNASLSTDTSAGYLDPNYNLWYVVTDTANATTKTTGTGNQEFLAYAGSSLTSVPTVVSSTPEPATFGLLGSALLFGAMLARRRKSPPSEKI